MWGQGENNGKHPSSEGCAAKKRNSLPSGRDKEMGRCDSKPTV
jgi:hypothetical protein